MPSAILNENNVLEAVKAIRSEGHNPTFNRIIEYCGGGSFGTLTKMRREQPELFGIGSSKVENSSEVCDLKMEIMELKFDSERRNLELKVDTLSKGNERLIKELDMEKAGVEALALEARALSKDNEALISKLDSSKARIQELESNLTSVTHEIDKAGTISKTDSDTTQLPIESISQEKSAKARAIELHEQYPNMKQREINDQLFDEGFKAKSGKRLGSGSISKWLKLEKS